MRFLAFVYCMRFLAVKQKASCNAHRCGERMGVCVRQRAVRVRQRAVRVRHRAGRYAQCLIAHRLSNHSRTDALKSMNICKPYH